MSGELRRLMELIRVEEDTSGGENENNVVEKTRLWLLLQGNLAFFLHIAEIPF